MCAMTNLYSLAQRQIIVGIRQGCLVSPSLQPFTRRMEALDGFEGTCSGNTDGR